MRVWIASLALVAALGAPAANAADVVSDRAEATAVVIYRDSNGSLATSDVGDGVAMIVETRTLDLPAGDSTVRFRGVADTLIPQTASVVGLPGGLIEQNFDYDLLTPGALLARSVGEQVKVVRSLPGSGRVVETRGLVRSAPHGVLIESDGKVEALDCSGLPERLVFERAPAGLADSPTLSLQTSASRAGRYTVTLRYLAGAFNWSANYVATVRADGRTLDLTGWLSLANGSGSSFVDAPTQVLAGRLSRSGDTRPIEAEAIQTSSDCWPTSPWASMFWSNPAAIAAPPAIMLSAPSATELQEVVVTASRKAAQATQAELGDYKLYTLPSRTTVSAQQIKQVAFLNREAVPFERVYAFQAYGLDDEDVAGRLMLRLQNTTSGGLDAPLPAGVVTLRQPGPFGSPLLIGERPLEDTSVGLPVELTIAEADLPLDVEVVGAPHPNTFSGLRYAEKKVVMTNPKSQPVVVEFRQDLGGLGTRVLKEDSPHTNRGGNFVWRFELPPGASRTFHYAIEME